MHEPTQVIFRGIPHSDYVEEKILSKSAKLQQFYKDIKHCRVTVDVQKKHHHGNLYEIKIDVSVPNKEIVVNHKHHDEHSHEDIYVAIRDAFNAMQRKLEDHTNKRRGDIKSHLSTSRGSREKRKFLDENSQ